mmetsp:Transcript_79869/g.214602  ORF Transcript_79869/g.214602 Transcript_79869/m.214602 type:complete len:269 (+) Transcript_79869:720-1526(+)
MPGSGSRPSGLSRSRRPAGKRRRRSSRARACRDRCRRSRRLPAARRGGRVAVPTSPTTTTTATTTTGATTTKGRGRASAARAPRRRRPAALRSACGRARPRVRAHYSSSTVSSTSRYLRSIACMRLARASFSSSLGAGLVSFSQTSYHALAFCTSISALASSGGRISSAPKTRGETMSSMKPTCEKARFTFPRSFIACTGTPNFCSMSPCWKNSSNTCEAQIRHTRKGFMGFEMSAMWRHSFSRSLRDSGARRHSTHPGGGQSALLAA